MPPRDPVTIDFDDVEAVDAVARQFVACRFIPNELPLTIEVRCTEVRNSPVTLASFLRVNGAVNEWRHKQRPALPQ